ncbi:MAG TPA: GntR family transcriptional regulator [bacterium]
MNVSTVDRRRPDKLYAQLLQILRRPIERGEWKDGERIPTEDDLCVRYGVSKTTVRSAIEELVAMGYLQKVQGKGTFVRRRIPEECIRMAIHLNAERMEFSVAPRYQVLERATVPPPADVADHLSLGAADECWHLARLAVLHGLPLALERLYVPCRASVRDVGERGATAPLSACVEARCAARIQRLREKTDLRVPVERDAALLGISPGVPALRIRHFFYLGAERPVACAETLRCLDRCDRILEFERL